MTHADTIVRPRCIYCRSALRLVGYRAPNGRPVVLRICAHCDAPRTSEYGQHRPDSSVHTAREEKRRGFRPPWYRVLVYTCSARRIETVVRVNWRGGRPPGAVVGNCGHRVAPS